MKKTLLSLAVAGNLLTFLRRLSVTRGKREEKRKLRAGFSGRAGSFLFGLVL